MEEIIKTLNIREINYITLDYIDKYGNNKVLKLEYREENKDK